MYFSAMVLFCNILCNTVELISNSFSQKALTKKNNNNFDVLYKQYCRTLNNYGERKQNTKENS